MPGPKPLSGTLSEKQHALLEHISRRQTSSQRLVRRVNTIFIAADGASNESIARRLRLDRDTVRMWCRRWQAGAEALDAAEAAGDADKVLLARIEALLADAPRPGAPGDFRAAQRAQSLAVACESPEDSGRPVDPLDTAGVGRGGDQARHCHAHLAPHGGAFFQRMPISRRIARLTG